MTSPDAASGGARAAAREGARDALPIVLGTIPFGLVAGATAVATGIGLLGGSIFSTFVFAGASQLAAMDLLGRDAPMAVAIGTALVINLRMLMYSAAMAPLFSELPLRTRLGAAYVLTDQAFALSVVRAGRTRRQLLAYYWGAGWTMWLNWQVWTILGGLLGAAIPDRIPLHYAIPLMFLGLLIPALTDRATRIAAVTAAVVAVLAAPLPANLGMPLAALSGIVAGVLVAQRSNGLADLADDLADPADPADPGAAA